MTKITKKIINESINKSITLIKCPATGKARKRGSNGVFDGSILKYDDGTSVEYGDDGTVKNITLDGVDYNYLGQDAYDQFENQKEELQNSGEIIIGEDSDFPYVFENDYEFVKAYGDSFASVYGLGINDSLRNNEDLGELFLGEGHNHFVELCNRMRIDMDNIICLRLQNNINHNTDNITRKIVKDKGHTSTSVGTDFMTLAETFTTHADNGIPWEIYTVVKKGSGVTGLFLGNPLKDERGIDWETEVNFAPKTRFERDLIDETNHIIIQHVTV